MEDKFDHYITNSIKNYYKTRIISPIVFICFLLILAFLVPVLSMLHPTTFTEGDSLADYYDSNKRYVNASLGDLYFTGYTKKWLDNTTGYYYYTMNGDDCIIVLLDPVSCEQGISTIDQITVSAEILKNSEAEYRLLQNLAEDLNWTESGITSTISSYMLSEPDAVGYKTELFKFLYILLFIYSVVSIIVYFLYIRFPVISKPCRALASYGNRRKLLAEAEEELATLPQLATDDMFITEHYFIETSSFGVAILPISEIIWIYKYSTLHKFLWHHFSISYTLYITAKKRVNIHCPKNTKTDIDGIMDYLAEANHDILVGFSEENRKTVEAMQGDTILLRKFLAFLSRKV